MCTSFYSIIILLRGAARLTASLMQERIGGQSAACDPGLFLFWL